MTRDANKQSVKCDNGHHQWTRTKDPKYADRYLHRADTKRIICAKCDTHPKASELERIDAVLDLRHILKPGMTIYTNQQAPRGSERRRGMKTFVDGIETISCTECNGDGVYYCSECHQETTACETCHGTGGVPKDATSTKET